MIKMTQEKALQMAEKAYEGFKKAIWENKRSVIDKQSEPILKSFFVNGYMKGMVDLSNLGKPVPKNAS